MRGQCLILLGCIPWRTRSLSLCSRLMLMCDRGVIISLCLLLLWCHDLTTTIGGGPMIGIDRIISTTKHQTVVFESAGKICKVQRIQSCTSTILCFRSVGWRPLIYLFCVCCYAFLLSDSLACLILWFNSFGSFLCGVFSVCGCMILCAKTKRLM